jgi:hypothetical protein
MFRKPLVQKRERSESLTPLMVRETRSLRPAGQSVGNR